MKGVRFYVHATHTQIKKTKKQTQDSPVCLPSNAEGRVGNGHGGDALGKAAHRKTGADCGGPEALIRLGFARQASLAQLHSRLHGTSAKTAATVSRALNKQ